MKRQFGHAQGHIIAKSLLGVGRREETVFALMGRHSIQAQESYEFHVLEFVNTGLQLCTKVHWQDSHP